MCIRDSIWDELYKVIDSSDIIVEILDARDPMGTRTRHVEEYIKKNCPHKHIVFILNKCDLVPTAISARWVKLLSQEYPTISFKASINNPFGKATLVQLLKQFDTLMKEKKTIGVGFIGYPNVGKSSVTVSYTHLRAHETSLHLVCRLLLEKKKKKSKTYRHQVIYDNQQC
eukprot:TRINITY_DN24300_c0_g1_i1.p1 TRINITY_DN24300_c0_g1~~TRINITY_DN24300_c0_g1_i1.p1  ORF type:complete len:171 (-),score=25.84 TRINITY_DN24300_c0_g1_i1:77-589(-)